MSSVNDKRKPATETSAAISIRAYTSVTDNIGKAIELPDWPAFVAYLGTRLDETAPSKKALPLIGPHTLRAGGKRDLPGVESVTLGALDLDTDIHDVEAVLEVISAWGWAAVVHTSPRDPQPETRKLRAYFPLSRPLAPHECGPLRKVIADSLGVIVDPQTLDASRFLFVGAIKGTPARELWEIEGEPLPVDELLAIELVPEPSAERKAKPAPSVPRGEPADDNDPVVALVRHEWETGARHPINRALASKLAQLGWDDTRIAGIFRALGCDREGCGPEHRVREAIKAAHQAREFHGHGRGEQPPGWKELRERFGVEGAQAIKDAAKDPRMPDDFKGVWSEAEARRQEMHAKWAENWAKRDAKQKAEHDGKGAGPFAPAADTATPSVPMFLCSRKSKLTLMWEGDELGHRPIAEHRIKMRCRELGYDTSSVDLGKANSKSVDTILQQYGESYVHTACAFANRVTKYDPAGEGSVLIGYPRAPLVARFDADADAWLRALGGEHYERLAVWIASCAQGAIDRLAACLVLMGRSNSGKTMFAHAVARMWGQTPPELGLIKEKFNGDLLRCPILADEEAKFIGSRDLTSNEFRDMIQQPFRSVELKGQERCELYGAVRAVVSCNGVSDLKFKNLGGPSVIEALRDRLLVIDATERAELCKALLVPLRLEGGWRVDLERIAGHMAWLCETIALPAERFLGAGGESGDAAILAGLVDEHVDLWETFRDWIDAEGVGGAWIAHEGNLCVDTGELAKSIERTGKGWDHRQVRAALAPFHTRDAQLGGDGVRRRVWGLDAARIADALGLGPDELTALEKRLATRAPDQPRKGGRFERAKVRQ